MNTFKLAMAPLVAGLLFSIGLGVSGMTEPAKILSFLDLFGNWDPSLMFVMVGAIGVNAILHQFITKRTRPLFDSQFYLPSKNKLDKKLLIGSAIFGIGWGVTGLCPGPGLAAISTGHSYALAFVISLLVGMGAIKFFFVKNQKLNKTQES